MIPYRRPPARTDLTAALLLALLVVPTRLLVAGRYLGSWDSVQYALAIEHFDVSLHQPHPPGYILLVGLLRLANLGLADARLAMLAVNTLFGALAVGLTYLLGVRLFGRLTGLAAALLLLSSPTLWYCGATYEPYCVLAGLSALVGWLCYRVVQGEHRLLPAATVALGLGGGVRPDAALFLLPLWLLALGRAASERREGRLRLAAGHTALLALIGLAWYLPLVYLSGGWQSYNQLSSAQLTHCFQAKSILFGAPWHDQAVMAFRHAVNLVLALGPLWAVFLLLGLPLLVRSRQGGPLARAFLLVWLAPAVLFYTLIFFSKPGYVLIYLPALALLAGRAFDLLEATFSRHLSGERASAGGALALAAALAVSAGLFLAGPSPLAGEGHPQDLAGRLLELTQAEAASVSRGAITAGDRRLELYLAALRHFSPRKSVIVCRASLPDWRQLMYYLRDYDVYWLVDERLMRRTPNGSEFWLAHGGKVQLSSTGAGFWLPGRHSEQLSVPIPPSIEDILLVTAESDPLLPGLADRLARLDLGADEHLLRLRLGAARALTTDRFIFDRAEPAPEAPVVAAAGSLPAQAARP